MIPSMSYPSELLTAGIVLTTASHMRYSSPLLAWVAYVPFLLYTKEDDFSTLHLLLALVIAWTLVTVKICTHPIPVFFAPMYGIPLGLIHAGGILMWGKGFETKDTSNDLKALAFPACMVIAEWFQYEFTPLGSWGVVAYTQVYNLPFLQLASIAGLAGPSFFVYWFTALVALTIHENYYFSSPVISLSTSFAVWGILMAGIWQWGVSRLDSTSEQETVLVAAVGTDAKFGGLPLPSQKEIELYNENLWNRSERAAKAGAKLVSWTEGATLILPEREPAFLEEARKKVKKLQIDTVLSYIVPIETRPLKYLNKAVWIRPDGTIDHAYLKNEPVPGEPAMRGEKHHVTVVETAFGVRAAVAICYDYDFPYIARNHALKNVGLVVVPSSDWQGIDPTHTQMAAVRAIESGCSILRSTRFGLSAGIDSTGRMLGQSSANKSQERLLLVSIPAIRKDENDSISTVYGRFGDMLVYLCLGLLVGWNFMEIANNRPE
jgi:apolipoprotein N-acyltransferase